MRRNDEGFLLHWLESASRKPLILRGARQVGKSTLVRQLAERADLPLWEVNLERFAALDAVFQTLDPDTILREIGIRLGRPGVGQGRGILFLDEIQAAPRAITALRYFHELRPELPVVAAGSLLEFTLSQGGFSVPVGRVEYHFLGPMTFTEFLEALGEQLPLDELRSFQLPGEFSEAAHERLLGLLREYFVVGGMPEAVVRYAQDRDPMGAAAVHRSILQTYVDDFSTYARGNDLERIRRIFEALPVNLGQKVRYNRFHPDWRAADVRRGLDLLVRAGIATAVTHTDGNGVPLGAEEDPTVYKLFHLDVGLVGSATGLGHIPFEDFREGRFVNEGILAEQFVAQHLLYAKGPSEKPKLYYWQRGGSRRNAEVDFLLQRSSEVLPVEVKAGASGSLRSLHQFMLKHRGGTAVRLDLNRPAIQPMQIDVMAHEERVTVDYRLVNLPLYLAERVQSLLP